MATQINYKQIKAEADLYKYQIVPSISSWNLTVALKNYLWQSPSVTTPVKVQIWDTVRTITSALILTLNSWNNYFNAWSSELATKEIDYFVYIISDMNWSWNVWISISRIPYWITREDFDFTFSSNEKFMNWLYYSAVWTKVVNIWRFNAILSAWPSYTWSIPATSVIINRPDYWLKEQESLNYKYHFEWNKVIMRRNLSITLNAWNDYWYADLSTYPFTFPDTNYHISNSWAQGSSFASFNETPFVYYNDITTSTCRIWLITRSWNVAANRTTTIKCRLEGKI